MRYGNRVGNRLEEFGSGKTPQTHPANAKVTLKGVGPLAADH